MKILKKVFIIFSCFLFLFSSAGCKSNSSNNSSKSNITTSIKKAKKKKLPKMNKDEMEAVYIIEDAQYFRIIKSRFQRNSKKAKTSEDKTVVFCQYADSLYRLCYTRCSINMNDSSSSKYYQNYLSYLYTYCDLYQSDMQSVVEKMKVDDENVLVDPIWASITDLDTFYEQVLDKDVLDSKIGKKAQRYIKILKQNKKLEGDTKADQDVNELYENYYNNLSSDSSNNGQSSNSSSEQSQNQNSQDQQ